MNGVQQDVEDFVNAVLTILSPVKLVYFRLYSKFIRNYSSALSNSIFLQNLYERVSSDAVENFVQVIEIVILLEKVNLVGH